MIFKPGTVAVALVLMVGAPAFAATYQMDGLTFETKERQSTLKGGDAARLQGTEFLGTTFGGSVEAGGIAGGVSRIALPDFTFGARLAAWEACRNSFFSSLCGSRPTDGSSSITVDTRTGAEIGLSGSGRAGLEFNYELDAGSTAATAVFNVGAAVPAAGTVRAGEAFSIGTTSTLAGGRIDVNGPTAEASIDAVLEVNGTLSGAGCLAGFGCSTFSEPTPKIDLDVELLRANPNEIVLLDGIAPEGVEVRIPVADRSFALDLEFSAAAGGVPRPVVKPRNSGTPDPSIGLSIGEFSIQLPEFDEVGGVKGSALAVNATSDYIDLTGDIDTLLTAFGGIPPLGVTVSGGPLFASVDLIDLDIGPSIDVFQNLELSSRVKVDFEFDKLVEIGGSLVDSFSGFWDSLPDFTVFSPTRFSPTFSLVSELTSAIGLDFALELTLDALKASAGIGLFGTNLFEVNLGPLASETFTLADFGSVTLASDSFDFFGFADQTVAGTAFYVTPAGFRAPGTPPVPLPAAGWLLLGGMGGLFALARRRRGRRSRLNAGRAATRRPFLHAGMLRISR
jgi:hypothetical protein